MSEQIHQHSRPNFAAQGALEKFADRAALLLDATGTIRAATPAAAALFQRRVSELAGIPFGIVPLTQPEIQVDLVNPGGRRRTVVARLVASDASRDWTVVLLAEQSQLLCEQAVQTALSDVAPVLAEYRLALEVGPWPFIEAHPSTRSLLAASIRCLVEKAAPQGGTLIVYAHLHASGWITIGLVLVGCHETPAVSANAADFDALAADVRATEGLLQLDLDAAGWGLQLMLPSGPQR